MRTFYFFSRVAFICGICFLLSMAVQFLDWPGDEQLRATIVIIGYAMGMVLIPLVNLAGIFLALFGRGMLGATPRWLIGANALFLILLFIYILLLNGPEPA